MSLWRQLTRGLANLVNRPAADRDVSDELDHYLEQATVEQLARGLPPDAARRAARLEVGPATAAREAVRSYGWENVVSTTAADLRYAARRLRQSPGFTAITVLTLALGIGATTAIFSAVNPILFEPLPYPEPGRILMLWDYAPALGRVDVTFGTYREVAERSRSFDALAVMRPWQPTMTGQAEPERLDGQQVSAGYFRALGVAPLLGRDFQPADDVLKGPRVVVLSDRLWRRRFAAQAGIVGQDIVLNDDHYRVIGVMPAGFENVLAASAELWTPLQYDTSLPPQGREWGHHLRMVGRLNAGISAAQATRELATIAERPVAEFPRVPWASLAQGFVVNPLRDDVTRAVKPALLAVLGAVVLVLLIAVVNVTNLLLARGALRRGEMAMRVALGAGRRRLIRQLLTESLLLAAIGGALGMLVAQLGIRALVALSPAGLPRVGAIGLDAAVFGFAAGVTALVGLLVGLVPALQVSRGELHSGLQQGSRRSSARHGAARRALVVAEVALALVLLVGAGLLLRSLGRLFAVAPGFDPAGLLTMQVQTSGYRFADNATTHRFFAQALDAATQVPGVAAASLTSQLPLSGDFEKYGVQLESVPDVDPEEDTSVLRYAVSSGYFQTMGIPLLRGRLLDAHDQADAPPVVVVNESFVKRRFPGQDPIGQRMHLGETSRPWYTIVGVVGNVKQTSLAIGQEDAAYTTPTQWPWADNPMWLVLRSRGDAASLAAPVRRAIWSVDKDQPIVRVATMDGLVAASAAERRFALIIFEAFALAALVLAAAGIYGVLSGSVTERMREIGVRAALGASRPAILGLVVRQGMGLAGLGALLGLLGAAAASRALNTLLFGVSPLDPLTYLGVVGVLLAVSAAACWLPAWRAARIDPAITLRTE